MEQNIQEKIMSLKYQIVNNTSGPGRIRKSQLFFRYGLMHRVDGPAIEYCTGYKEWWIHGVEKGNNNNDIEI